MTWRDCVDADGVLDPAAAAGVLRRVVVERATGAAAGGHPAAGLVWLAGELAARGQVLEAGELVITGGLTSARLLEGGHVIGATFGRERVPVEARRPAGCSRR